MKAVVCEAFGGPEVLHVRDVPDPPPPGPGEVQVRIRARGVQYVDVLMLAGKYQFRPEPPFIPGNEGAGEVVAVGEGDPVQAGDQVISRRPARRPCRTRQCKESDCDKVPAGLSLEQASVFRNAYMTAYHSLFSAAGSGRRQGADPRRRRRHRHPGDPARQAFRRDRHRRRQHR